MQIKIKVKHLLTLIAGLVLFGVLLTQWAIPHFQVKQTAEEISGDLSQEQKKILAKLENGSLSEQNRLELIEENMIKGPTYRQYDVYTGPSSTEMPGLPNQNELSMEIREPYLLEYIDDAPVKSLSRHVGYNFKYTDAVQEIAQYYWKNGKSNQAFAILDKAMERLKEYTDAYWNLKLLEMKFLAANNPDEALNQLKELRPTETFNVRFKLMEVRLLMNQKYYEEANTLVNDFIAKSDVPNMGIGATYLVNTATRLQAWKNGEQLYTVTGKLKTEDGKAIKHAGIYLREPSYVSQSIMEDEEAFETVTKEDGTFTISGVPAGNYQVYLGMNFNQISGYRYAVNTFNWASITEDKNLDLQLNKLITINSPGNYKDLNKSITFDWEPVKDAAYYRVYVGLDTNGYNGAAVIKDNVKSTSLKVPEARLASFRGGVGASSQADGSGMRVIPESLLWLENPNADLYWYVEAFDKNNQFITSSNGYRLTKETMGNIPYFHYKAHQLTEADKLLLNDKLKEALASYKEDYQNNPNDLHSLRMITQILTIRFPEVKIGEDPLPYIKELAEKTNDSEAWFTLTMMYYHQGNWKKFFQTYDKFDHLDTNLSTYDQGIYAIALMKNGQFNQAEEILQDIVEEDDTHRFMPQWLVLTIHQQGFDEAITIAEKYPDLSITQVDWAKRLKEMKKEVAADNELKDKFDRALHQYFQLSPIDFKKWIQQESNEKIKTFFNELN